MLKEDHNKERDKIINNHNKEHTTIDQHKIKDQNKSLLRKFKTLRKKHNNNNQSSMRRKRSKIKRNNHQWRNKNTKKKFNRQQQQQKLNTNNKNKNNQFINNQNKPNIINNKSHKPNNIMYQSMRRKSINHHIMNLPSNKHIRSNRTLNIMWNLPIMSKRRHMRIITKSNIQLRKRLLVIMMKSYQLLNHPNRNRLTVFQLYKTLILLLLGKISNKHAIKTHSFLSLFNLKLTHKEFPTSELLMVAWKMSKSESLEQALKDHKKHFDHVFIKNL